MKFYEENCIICMDELKYDNYPSITPCCNQLLCFDCLIEMKKYNKKIKCPNCRKYIDIKSVCVLNDKIKDKTKNNDGKKNKKKYTKIDILNEILENNKNGKYLIFSEHDESFVKIEKLLINKKLKYREMKGNNMVITNIIKQFTQGHLNVLLLNTQHMGAGLNLQMCSDIILFHRQRNDLEKQLIGRGQRLGRTNSLKVHYLLHDNEVYLPNSEIKKYDEL